MIVTYILYADFRVNIMKLLIMMESEIFQVTMREVND